MRASKGAAQLPWILLLLVLLAAWPLVAGEYFVNLASQIVIAAVFAASLNLLVGYAGLTSLGHATWLGFSAYASAYVGTHFGLGHAWSAPAALLATTLLGMIFGAIALRATGLGFLMLTLALSQIVWGVALRWVGLTNGDNGISGLTRPMPFGWDLEVSRNYYWFALIVAALSVWLMARFVGSAFGAALRGTRDQPRRMSALGFDVGFVRWVTFVVASFFGGVAGLLYVWFHKFAHPSILALPVSAEALLSVIAGGSGTLAGPLLGALLVVVLKTYASAYIERWNLLLGAVFVAIVIFMPAGIGPGIAHALRRLRDRRP